MKSRAQVWWGLYDGHASEFARLDGFVSRESTCCSSGTHCPERYSSQQGDDGREVGCDDESDGGECGRRVYVYPNMGGVVGLAVGNGVMEIPPGGLRPVVEIGYGVAVQSDGPVRSPAYFDQCNGLAVNVRVVGEQVTGVQGRTFPFVNCQGVRNGEGRIVNGNDGNRNDGNRGSAAVGGVREAVCGSFGTIVGIGYGSRFEGCGPVVSMLLSWKRLSREERLEISSGMALDSILLMRAIAFKRGRFPNYGGMDPERLLLFRYKWVRTDRLASSVGMVPVRRFLHRFIYCSWEMLKAKGEQARLAGCFSG